MTKKLPYGIKIDKKNGGYHTYISLGTDPITKKRIRKHLRDKDVKSLEYKVIQLKMKYLQGEKINELKTPFKHIYIAYMQERDKQVKNGELTKRTQLDYKQMCDRHILPYFEETQSIRDIKLAHLEQYIEILQDKNELSNNRINKIIIALSQIFTFAERQNAISNNPTRLLKKLREQKPIEKQVLTPEQVITLLNSIDENKSLQNLIFKTTLAINYGCGFRISEIAGILKEDIFYENKRMVIPITKSLQRIKGGYDLVDRPKTKNGYRSIVLPKITQELVEKLIKVSPQHWKFLLQRKENKPPYNQDTYNNFLKSQCSELGLPIITSHNLRHSVASLLMLEHNDEIAIQRYMGHSKIEFTRNQYGHTFHDAQFNIANLIDTKLN